MVKLQTLNLTYDAPPSEPKAVQEALSPMLMQIGDPEDAKFKRITSPYSKRDLNPVMQERMQQVCYFLSVTTPFGKRIVEVITSYVVGEGFKVTAKDPAVQEIVDRFWDDPVNDFERTLKDWSDDLVRFGELCIPVVTNPVDGFVRVGFIDPIEIEAIEYGVLQTGDGTAEVSVPVAVHLKRRLNESSGRRLTIVRPDEDPNSETFGELIGECFYFSINKGKSASRGISDLFSLADWIDVLDQMIFDFADKVRMLNTFIWEFVLKGADEDTVKKFQRQVTNNPPRQGGFQVHNEQVEINTKTPDFKGADMHESARMVKLYGLGGIGLPPMFFADPVDANRSTASEMEGPTGKKLTDRQNELRRMIRQIITFVLDKAVAHGTLQKDVDRSVSVEAPDMMIKDLQKASTVMQGTAQSVALAEDRGWIRGETAARAFHAVLSQLGIEVNSKEEYDLAQQEKQTKDANSINALDPQQNLADALNRIGDPNGNGGGVQ